MRLLYVFTAVSYIVTSLAIIGALWEAWSYVSKGNRRKVEVTKPPTYTYMGWMADEEPIAR